MAAKLWARWPLVAPAFISAINNFAALEDSFFSKSFIFVFFCCCDVDAGVAASVALVDINIKYCCWYYNNLSVVVVVLLNVVNNSGFLAFSILCKEKKKRSSFVLNLNSEL